jgi:WD40 repeat protein
LPPWLCARSRRSLHAGYFTAPRDQPIHCRSLDGELATTYRPINHLDEISAAVSLCFSVDGSTIYAGGISALRVFDIQRPGKQVRSLTLATRRARKGSAQKGLIGCIAVPQAASSLVACGSYGRSVCVYDLDAEKSANRPQLWLLDEGMGGVTHIEWPDENFLVSGHRADPWLRVWDLRYPAEPVFRLPRSCKTQQRLLFDAREDLVVSGDDSGVVHAYSLATGEVTGSVRCSTAPVVAARWSPAGDLVLTSTGTRSFRHDLDYPSPPASPRALEAWLRDPPPAKRPRADTAVAVWRYEAWCTDEGSG